MVQRPARRAGPPRAIGAGLAIGDGLVVLRLQPVAPRLFRLRGQQVDARESPVAGEARRAFADQEGVGGVLHHRAGDRDGVDRILQRGDRADAACIVHDDRVQRDMSVAIGIAAIADRMVVRIGLRHHHARLDHIDQRSAAASPGEGGVIGGGAEVPGGHDDGVGPGTCHRRRLGQRAHRRGEPRPDRAPHSRQRGDPAQKSAPFVLHDMLHPQRVRSTRLFGPILRGECKCRKGSANRYGTTSSNQRD